MAEKITKVDAIRLFRFKYPNTLGSNDKGLIRYNWNTFVDGLQKDNLISEYQASVWVNPFLSKKDR